MRYRPAGRSNGRSRCIVDHRPRIGVGWMLLVNTAEDRYGRGESLPLVPRNLATPSCAAKQW